MRRAAAVLLMLCWTAGAEAQTLRWAYERDVRSLDPYASQETFLQSFDGNIYEPLVRRGRGLAIEPALAASWRMVSPTLWRFRLRAGVVFQDGTPFAAADVLYSFGRARARQSRIAARLAAIDRIEALDDHTIEIATKGRDPLLLEELADWPIMSRQWCEAHDAAYAADHANGTGPFALEERVPDERTVLAANPRWWDQRQGNVERAVFTPVADPDALAGDVEAGALDMVYDVPASAIDRIAAVPGFRLLEVPGFTTIFLGFDEWSRTLPDGGAQGNPFTDRRVRAAVAAAIDERAIISQVMRGHASPAGTLAAPGVDGYAAKLDLRPPYDPARARMLLAEAGYAHGFATGMDCPDDRYMNDAAICEEIVAMLAKVGIEVDLHEEDRARFFERIVPQTPPKARSSFFLMGWTESGHDAESALVSLAAGRDPDGRMGAFNAAGYSNPALDTLLRRIDGETDAAARTALLERGLAIVKADDAYIPLHRQNVIWAARQGIDLTPRADNSFRLTDVRMK